MKILELINTIMEMINSLETNSTSDLRQHKRISELEDRSIWIVSCEGQHLKNEEKWIKPKRSMEHHQECQHICDWST